MAHIACPAMYEWIWIPPRIHDMETVKIGFDMQGFRLLFQQLGIQLGMMSQHMRVVQ